MNTVPMRLPAILVVAEVWNDVININCGEDLLQ